QTLLACAEVREDVARGGAADRLLALPVTLVGAGHDDAVLVRDQIDDVLAMLGEKAGLERALRLGAQIEGGDRAIGTLPLQLRARPALRLADVDRGLGIGRADARAANARRDRITARGIGLEIVETAAHCLQILLQIAGPNLRDGGLTRRSGGIREPRREKAPGGRAP